MPVASALAAEEKALSFGAGYFRSSTCEAPSVVVRNGNCTVDVWPISETPGFAEGRHIRDEGLDCEPLGLRSRVIGNRCADLDRVLGDLDGRLVRLGGDDVEGDGDREARVVQE